MASAVKAIRPNRLREDESLSTFEDWRNNLEFYLQQEKAFVIFLRAETSWNKISEGVEFRGLDSAEEARNLQQFLGVIASLSPPLLHGDIINDTTKISDVYKLLRSYYQFAPSESTFIKFSYIKREIIDGKLERPLHLYLRMRQFVRDNLLLSSGRIVHDGKIPDRDEVFSPTAERLIVLRWLEVLHPSLPNHIANVFAHDLQTKSLKDLQPQISDQIEELILQAEGKSQELDAQFTRLSTRNRKFDKDGRKQENTRYNKQEDTRYNNFEMKYDYGRKGSYSRKPLNLVKKCEICRSVGEPFIGHDTRNCPNIVPSARSNLMKNFNLELDPTYDNTENDDIERQDYTEECSHVEIDRVSIVASPQFNIKIDKTMITMILDTGATGSMISLKICELARLRIYPSSHRAVLADGNSQLTVVGEIHTSIVMEGGLILPLSAVVVTKLKAGLIVGMNFMRENKVIIDIPGNKLRFPNNHIVHFNNSLGNPKVALLRADVNNVIFPGDSFMVPIPANFYEDISIAVEPRVENSHWPIPCIVENENGFLPIMNHLDKPIILKRNQVIAQVRSVISESNQSLTPNDIIIPPYKEPPFSVTHNNPLECIKRIVIDPDGIMTQCDKSNFERVNEKYQGVFNPNFGTYNDKSGKIRASVLLGKTKPTPKKGKVPSYCSNKSAILQQKFDELEALGILSHPEDVNVDVIHTSPSFLVKKPNGSHRLVTSFVELNKFIRPLPSKLSTTSDVMKALGRWKYIIKTDLKSAYFQMRVTNESQKWLGTNSPFKGMYVYNRGAMGLRNMAEFLEEIVVRVLGDFVAEGIMTKNSDDLIIGGNSIDELLRNWSRVLQRLSENNLSISADKTFICPKSIKILGWIWREGKIEVDRHRINPLTVSPLPVKVKQMRSFIGAFRAVSICIPAYSNYLNDLEDLVAGKESTEKIVWNDHLTTKFKDAQKALCNPKVITLPHPDDQLILISDGCNSPPAVGSTLYLKRGPNTHIAGFFSAKIKKYQLLWLPCEVEALCINLTISSFANFIRESKHTTKFLTDSKTCVQAFEKLSRGGFSLSPRISSFLMNLNSLNISINHVKGSDIVLPDFCSRNPIQCSEKCCQVCQFVEETADLEVNTIDVGDIISGVSKMPYYNSNAWKEAQKKDSDLRRTYSQLCSGTRPGKKEKDLKQLRRYLQIACISNNGTLIHRKPNPYGKDFELIIVPYELAAGLITALHLRLGHPKKSQIKKVWDRYFYALDIEKWIDQCMDSCSLCRSLKTIPKELIEQSTTPLPDTVGITFSADIIRRNKQKIILLIDIFSSFKLGQLIQDEKQETFQQSLIQLSSSLKHPDGCFIRVDNATGFIALKDDKILQSLGIKLEYGRIKNKNHNPTIDKAIQEVEYEIKCLAPSGGPITPGVLATAISNSNSRIRSNGLSAKEILFKRDSVTNQPIEFSDDQIKRFRYNKRVQNHTYSELSKSHGKSLAKREIFFQGDIVHIKSEGSKHLARDFYLVMSIDHDKQEAEIQKFSSNQLRSKKYRIKLSEIYLASPQYTNRDQDRSDDDENGVPLCEIPEKVNTEGRNSPTLRRSDRSRNKPNWLSTNEIQRLDYA